ncbi:MAG: hypothetical protein EBS49_01650 [Verrucomicrobia bacterium]|nr:hypothetical protein [Verrucomicrobiota bacterium]NBU68326.1 hypothetical protein [Verrucomicrobiota bacterium]
MIAHFGKPHLLLVMMLVSSVWADEVPEPDPAPSREFSGETKKEVSGSSHARPIFTAAEYEGVWKDLGLAGSPGEVDFLRECVVLATTRGSRVGLRCRDEGGGKLTVSAMSTRDIRPGLRYVFGVFSKKEWKEINGSSVP